MARRLRKSCRLPLLLAELICMQGWLVPAAHASNAADSAAPVANPALIADGGNPTSQAGNDLYLDVILNGASSGLAHFSLREGQLWASQATLRQLGFALPPGMSDPLRLGSLPGSMVAYDASQQTVKINVPLRLLRLSTTVLNTPTAAAKKPAASPGALLNYEVYGTRGEHGTGSLSAFTELRVFGPAGVFSSTSLTQATRGGGSGSSGSTDKTVRLDTSFSTSFPDSLLTLRFGDTLTGAQSWTRSTRIGGIQLGTNFALQPYLITAPLPAFLGSATLPSQVDLYVNGLRQYSGKVPTGPFQLNAIPNISGAGNAQVVLTDALGRATTLNFSLYDTHQLLQQGLSQWSADIGYVRENYGLASFDYGRDPAASGNWRYGVSNRFTAEAHGEVTAGLTEAGAGGVWLLGDSAGVVSGSLAQSEHRGRSGSQYSLGYSWRNSRFNFSVDETRTRGDYLDVASLYGAPPPSVSTQAVVGYSAGHLGEFGVSYLDLRYPAQDPSRYATVYWFKSIGHAMSLSLSANQNLDNAADRSLFAGFNVVLDGGTTVSTGVQRDGTSTGLSLDASQSAPSAGGWGWRADLRQGGSQDGGQGEVDYLGRYGMLDAGISSIAGQNYGYAGATGSLVFMGGEVFAARRIDDAFAVVSTDGVAGVPVKLENNPIGSTDRHGMLLVEPLNAYQNNEVSIDPLPLPPDVRIDHVRTTATPTDRAGTLVKFSLVPVQAGLLTLVDAQGKPLALGSQVRVHGQRGGDPALVGFDGQAYLETLEKHTVLDVLTPDGECHAAFDYRKAGPTIAHIGPLRCVLETSR
jgi:outer membrane usher protein